MGGPYKDGGRYNGHQLKWIKIFACYLCVMMTANVGLMIGFAAGGYGTIETMGGMSRNMDKMTLGSDQLNATVIGIMKKLPSNQLDVAAKQAFGTLQNAFLLSERVKFLTDGIGPGNIATIVDKLAVVANAVSPTEISTIKTHVEKIVENVNKVIEHINPDAVSNVLKTFADIDASKINTLTEWISKLQDIGIKIHV